MISYAEFIMEKLITFGGKSYPKFGNVVLLGGGGGSGKGFVKKNLMGIEGKSFDVDELKSLALRSDKIKKKVKAELDIDLEDFNKPNALKDPETVSLLHQILGDELKIPDKVNQAFFSSVLFSRPDLKPNIIFDVTLSTLEKFDSIITNVKRLGYDKKNIHIVWVINDIEVALTQNQKRSRTVKPEILINTHKGAAQTMLDIIGMGDHLSSYMDGDIVFAFNKVNVDSKLEKSEFGGKYIIDANYFYIKKAGQKVHDLKSINNNIRDKIKQYVPKNAEW